jgi:hypothetical protein
VDLIPFNPLKPLQTEQALRRLLQRWLLIVSHLSCDPPNDTTVNGARIAATSCWYFWNRGYNNNPVFVVRENLNGKMGKNTRLPKMLLRVYMTKACIYSCKCVYWIQCARALPYPKKIQRAKPLTTEQARYSCVRGRVIPVVVDREITALPNRRPQNLGLDCNNMSRRYCIPLLLVKERTRWGITLPDEPDGRHDDD